MRHCLKVGSEYIWLWIAIEPENKQISHYMYQKREHVFANAFYQALLKNTKASYSIRTDGGNWYAQACSFMKLKHHLPSSYANSSIERTMNYVKDKMF